MNIYFVNKYLQTNRQNLHLMLIASLMFFLPNCDFKIFINDNPVSSTGFYIRGIVNGLTAGDVLILQNNGADNVTITASGSGTISFSFPTALTSSATYNVSVNTQPTAKNCDTITGAFGSVKNSDILDIVVTCTAGPFSVGGTVTGLPDATYSVTVQFTYTNPLQASVTIYPSISGNTGLPVTFLSSPILSPNATYNTTVWSTSANLACSAMANGTGTIFNINKTDMSLNCGTCGNGIVDGPETCDDGNFISGDACDATCGITYANPVSFDNGTMKGWIANGLWSISNSRSSTGSYSMRYADAAANNFNTPGLANSGAMTSSFTPVLTAAAKISFDYFKFGECPQNAMCTVDKLSVEISTDGGITWTVVENLPEEHFALIPHTTILGAWAGSTAKIRFFFNTVNSITNTFEGAYIDNINVIP